MTPHSPEACARAGIPYTPEWRERVGSPVYGSISPMEYAEMHAEPIPEPEHAVVERALHRGSRLSRLVRVGSYEYSEAWWKHEWRSLPDYDGGGNASSGILRGFGYDAGSAEMLEHITMIWVRSGYFGVVSKDQSARELHEMFMSGTREQFFGTPENGGRGWCPKLAGVE